MKKLLQKNSVRSFALSAVMTAFSAVAVAAGITVNVETPEGTPQCYFNGAMSDNTWDIMKKVSPNQFTINFPKATEIGWGYQFSWNTSFDDANAAPNGNITVKPDENGIIDVKVFGWKTTPIMYGILVNGSQEVKGCRSDDTPDGYSSQWEVLGVELDADDTFQMYDLTNKKAWVGKVEGNTGITVKDNAYLVSKAGKYDLYLKLESENDMLYAEGAKELVWRVAGEKAFLGVEWDATADANKMTKQEDGTYKLVKNHVSLKEKRDAEGKGGYKYKYAANGSWNITFPVDDSNCGLDIVEDGKYTLTFVLDLGKGEEYAYATREGDIEYKYTTYKEWQVRTNWNGGEWETKNMTPKSAGVFTYEGQWGTGEGVNVYSGSNLVKQDWYPAGDINLNISPNLKQGDDAVITLTVVNDDTITLSVSPKVTKSESVPMAKAYVLRYKNLIGVEVPKSYNGVKIAEMSDGTTVKVQ